MKKSTAATLFGLSLVIGGAELYLVLQEDREKEQKSELVAKVSKVADINKSGTSSEEWARVYQELGKSYDVHASNPNKDLSITDLTNYLNKHH